MNDSTPLPTPEPAPKAPTERPGFTVKGPWIVAATLSLFVIVPAFVVVITLLLPDPQKDDAPFIWDDRQTWPRTFYTTFKSLERGMMSNARTNEVYKDLGFHLDADEQLAVIRCAALAKQPREDFLTEATLEQLETEIENQPELFYAHYLLAVWHDRHENPTSAQRHYTLAFEHAPAVLLRHHVTDAGESAVQTPIEPLAYAADQIVDDKLDRSAVLVFPHLETDTQGLIYLPVYKTILRAEDPSLPAGLTDLPAWEKYKWFTFVGRVGRLPDVTVN